MNKLIRKLEKKQMLVTMLSAFLLLLLLTFAINIVFYYQEAQNNEKQRRAFLTDSLQTKLNSYDSMMRTIRYDTEVLLGVPGFSDFAENGSFSELDIAYCTTYAQSRFAFNGIAYYQEDTRTLIGYLDQVLHCNGRDAILQTLSVSSLAWNTLLTEDGFVFTDEATPSVILSNRVAANVVCLRVIPYTTTMNYLQFIRNDSTSSLFPAWSLIVTDKIGQNLILGSDIFDQYAHVYEYDMPGSTDYHLVLHIDDRTSSTVWQYVNSALMYYGGALLILGTILIYLFVSHLYKPVRSILNTLPQDLSLDSARSEHDRIQEAIHLLCEKQASNEDLLQEQHVLLRQNFLQRLIVSNLVELDGVDPLLERYQLTSRFGQFSVFMLIPASASEKLEKLSLSRLVFPGFQLDVIFHRHDRLLMLASSMKEDADFSALATQLLSEIQAACGLHFQLYQSAVHFDITEANAAYLECSIAAEKHVLDPERSGIFSYGEVNSTFSDDARYNPLIALEQQLYQAILARQSIEAQQLFDEYCSRLMKTTFTLRLQKVQIVALLMHLISIPGASSCSADSIRETDLIALLSSRQEGEEFWTNAQTIARRILPQPVPRAEGRSERFNSMLDYIQEHLCEESLCASEIADHFGISASSLTREFQKNLNIGFSNYLHIQRINKAKLLLQQTTRPIKDIAAEVGYSSTLTLTRAFRKYEGTTPGAYRTTQVNL